MPSLEDRLFALHAEVCKALANPTRLKVLNALQQGEQSVQALAKRLKVRKANLSQHLAVLRQRGIVATRRDGLHMYYRCANPKMLKAWVIKREVLWEDWGKGEGPGAEASRRPGARRARHSAAATMAAAS